MCACVQDLHCPERFAIVACIRRAQPCYVALNALLLLPAFDKHSPAMIMVLLGSTHTVIHAYPGSVQRAWHVSGQLAPCVVTICVYCVQHVRKLR